MINSVPVGRLARRFLQRMTDEQEFEQEYTFEEAAVVLSRELPDFGMTRQRVREWVLIKKLCAYREFPVAPGSTKMTYRIDQENLDKLIKVGHDWYNQARPKKKRGDTSN